MACLNSDKLTSLLCGICRSVSLRREGKGTVLIDGGSGLNSSFCGTGGGDGGSSLIGETGTSSRTGAGVGTGIASAGAGTASISGVTGFLGPMPNLALQD